MPFFEFPIWDRHKNITFDEEGSSFIVPINDNTDAEPFKKFTAKIDTDHVKIEHIVEFMLFQTEDELPIKSSLLYLSDGSQYICRFSHETVEKNYIAHIQQNGSR